MTATEWEQCEAPGRLVQAVRPIASERRLRLFLCASCRRLWELLPEGGGLRQAVEVCERFADGFADANELAAARAATRKSPAPLVEKAALHASEAVWAATASQAISAVGGGLFSAWRAMKSAGWGTTEQLRREVCTLVRDVFGNPFRVLPFDPAWRTPDVIALAQVAYQERDLPSGYIEPLRLAVLADALEEVGATDAILRHLRGPGPHLRGCFVVDAGLGKS